MIWVLVVYLNGFSRLRTIPLSSLVGVDVLTLTVVTIADSVTMNIDTIVTIYLVLSSHYVIIITITV